MNTNHRLTILLEGAMMIGLAIVLSYIKVMDMPFGGQVSLEIIPLVIMGLRRGVKWGGFTGLVYGTIKMIYGFQNVLYCATLLSQIGCILLDYLLAFSVLGLGYAFAKPFLKNPKIAYPIGAVCVGVLSFACNFLSGWLLWSDYAPEGMNPVYYSLVYNGAYMGPNVLILAVIVTVLASKAPRLFHISKA